MDKTQDAFRTIGEVAEELDLPQHVLRFWETKFNQIRPVKRVGGRRYYRPEDVQLVAAIRILLYSEGYTIRGVQRILKEQGARALIAASQANGRGNGSKSPPPLPDDADTAPTAEPEGQTAFARAGGADGGAALSPGYRQRLEAVLAELDEGARILADARRR